MPDQLQLRGGTTVQHSTFTGASKEVTVDTTKKTAVVHDGATAGGIPVMREDASNSALALGSAGTPSLKFTGDTNTGIYSPGADQVAVATNGTGQLFIDASGNVGVGASPVVAFAGQTHLTVNHSLGGTTVAGINLATDGTRRASLITYPGNSEALRITAESTTLPITVHTNGSERLRITSAGLVGIGTTSPGSALEINAAAATSPFIAKINTAEVARIDSSGRLLVGASTAPTSSSGDAVLGLGNGGIAVSKQGLSTANSGTVDIQLINQSQRPYAGFLAVSNSLNANRSNRTQTTFSVFGDGTASSIQQISTASAGSAMSFTVTTPSDGVIRVTNTSGSTCDVTMVFYGCVTR